MCTDGCQRHLGQSISNTLPYNCSYIYIYQTECRLYTNGEQSYLPFALLFICHIYIGSNGIQNMIIEDDMKGSRRKKRKNGRNSQDYVDVSSTFTYLPGVSTERVSNPPYTQNHLLSGIMYVKPLVTEVYRVKNKCNSECNETVTLQQCLAQPKFGTQHYMKYLFILN